MNERFQVWTVQALLLATADALVARFGAAAVKGELAGFTRAASGHCYFTLKDSDGAAASMRCVMFRRAAGMLPFAPRDGQQVQLRGKVSVYEARGELQFVAESMSLAGAGALYEQFLRLKAKLDAEGLFDAARKRALRAHPSRVGVVTSLSAAALHDVTTAMQRRAPHVELVVFPSPVQGIDAPESLVAALAQATRFGSLDAILLVRGGGSLEDLWAFNDERVVRAVVASPVPVVVGVGHESDITLADLAADLRAATPTAAAELVAPARDALSAALLSIRSRAVRAAARTLEGHAVRLDRAGMLAAAPARGVSRQRERLSQLAGRVAPAGTMACRVAAMSLDRVGLRVLRSMRAGLDRTQARVRHAATRLQGVDPRRVLARGYAWVEDADGHPIGSVKGVAAGERFKAVLADGDIRAEVVEAVEVKRDMS